MKCCQNFSNEDLGAFLTKYSVESPTSSHAFCLHWSMYIYLLLSFSTNTHKHTATAESDGISNSPTIRLSPSLRHQPPNDTAPTIRHQFLPILLTLSLQLPTVIWCWANSIAIKPGADCSRHAHGCCGLIIFCLSSFKIQLRRFGASPQVYGGWADTWDST